MNIRFPATILPRYLPRCSVSKSRRVRKSLSSSDLGRSPHTFVIRLINGCHLGRYLNPPASTDAVVSFLLLLIGAFRRV